MNDDHVSAILQMRRRIEATAEIPLSPSARLVAWALLLHANAGGECWPKTATLRRLTGLDASTIRRIRPALRAAFDYELGGSEPGGKRHSTKYRFRLDRGPFAPGASQRPGAKVHRDRRHDALSTGGAMPPVPEAGCPPKDHKGPSEGSTKNGLAPTKRPNVARIVREVVEATSPPWPRRTAV